MVGHGVFLPVIDSGEARRVPMACSGRQSQKGDRPDPSTPLNAHAAHALEAEVLGAYLFELVEGSAFFDH